MRIVLTTVFVVAVAVLTQATDQTLQRDDLFPFGPTSSDAIFPSENDVSVEVNLKSPFTFYGKKYSSVFINDNGVLSFVNKVDQFQWEKLPLAIKPDEKHILIAPFLANVDVTVAGRIHYRETVEKKALQRASEKISQYFVRNSDFKPKNMLVVTWDQVGFFGSLADDPVTNTFQCVVTSDGVNTFVFYLYETVDWTTDAGPGSGGSPQTGLGTNAPQVGFDAGDTKNNKILDVEEEYDDGALSLPSVSNVEPANPPGFFIYQVSDTKVYFPACKKSDRLQIYPNHASMLGGIRLTFGGTCFRETDNIVFRFGDPATGDAIFGPAPCDYVSNYQATCIMPLMDRIGSVEVSLSVNGGVDWKDGELTIMPIGSEVPSVMRTNPWGMQWLTATTDVEITWDSSELDDDWVTVTILSYREENDTTANGAHEWMETDIAANVTNSGRYDISVGANSDITHANALGVIRVTAASKPDGLALTSDVHLLGYLLSDEGYQADPKAWSNSYCKEWYEEDQKKPPYVQDLNVCPCTLQQALADQARFVATPYCDSTKQTPESLKKLDYCFARPQIKHCVLGIIRNPSQSDSECCYDADDNLVYAQDSIYGSFSNRISRFSGAVPGLSGAATDLVPYLFCNVIGKDDDNYYRMARPTRDCKDYKPVQPAIVYGDPHFVTFDNSNYTFNGLGEYVLVRTAARSGATELRLEGRFERALDADGNPLDATVLTTLAIVENNQPENRIQIEKNDITMMTLKVGAFATVQDIGRSAYHQFPHFFVIFPGNPGSGVVPKMIFQFRVSQIGLVVEGAEDMLSAMILLPSEYKGKGEMEGLFGNWNDDKADDLKTPAGNTVPATASAQSIFTDFGQKWEATAPTLFAYSGSVDHSTYQNNSFAPVFKPTGSVSDRELNKVCGDDTFCRFDYQVTGNAAVAANSAKDSRDIKEAMAASEKLLTCPFLTTPAHGTKIFIGSKHHVTGSKVRYTCHDGYIFLGESQRECDDRGEWSDSSEPSCFEVKCGTLSPPDHGTMEVKVSGDVTTATFTCDEGVPMEGSKTRTCGADNKWTGEETKCIKKEAQGGGSNTAVIVVVVIIVIIVVAVAAGAIYYFYRKKHSTGSRKVTRPPDSAYQPVETKSAGDAAGDVELGTKKKPADEEDDGGFKEREKEKDEDIEKE